MDNSLPTPRPDTNGNGDVPMAETSIQPRARGGGSGTARQTQVVFVHLDPPLQELLQLTTKFKQLAERSSASQELDDEEFIQTMSKQTQALGRLDQAIQDLGPTFSSSLTVMADYISLPLTAILHVQINSGNKNLDNDTIPQESSSEEEKRKWKIVQSYFYQLYAATCRVLQTYVQITRHGGKDTKIESGDNAGTTVILPTTSLSSRHLTNYLIALANILPEQPQQHSNRKERQPQQLQTPVLDDGSDLWLALLGTIQAILEALPDPAKEPEASSAFSLTKIWDGALVARMVDGISAILSMSTSNNAAHLRAIVTLQHLLPAAPDPSLWQRIFPGVFLNTYRRLIQLHRQASTSSSSSSSSHVISIECEGLKFLASLFQTTIIAKTENQEQPSRTQTPASSATALLEQLQLRAKAPISDPSKAAATKEQQQQGDDDKSASSFLFFQAQVHQRVIAPLSVLLCQSAISKSPQVRLQVLRFCKVLLIGTNTFWTSPDKSPLTTTTTSAAMIDNNISELAMEICLMLESSSLSTLDSDPKVSLEASQILESYQTQILAAGGTNVSQLFTSKILEKIERLSTLAQGSKTIEIRNELNLIAGYLRALGPHGSAALAASALMRKSLVATLDIDFSSAGNPAITAIGTSPTMHNGSLLKYRYLNAEAAIAARPVLEALGAALGHKHGAIVVDALLADMFESISGSMTTQDPLALSGDAFLEWMHQWIGTLTVADGILMGAFNVSESDEETNPKRAKRRLRVLNSLASSILPLLCESSTLWQLPTQDLSRFAWSTQNPSERTTTTQAARPSTLRFFQANTCMMVLTIQLISSFLTLLQQDGKKFQPLLFFALAEKANPLHSTLVQTVAQKCIQKLGVTNDGPNSNVANLVAQNFNSFLAGMMGRLRLPGGIRVPKDDEFDENILRVAVSLRWVLEQAQGADVERLDGPSHQAAATTMMDVVKLIIIRVDHWKLNKKLSENSILEFNILYKASLNYLLVHWGASSEEVYTHTLQNQNQEPAQSWLELLSPYRRASNLPDSKHKGDEVGNESPATEFAENDTENADKRPMLSEKETSFVSVVISRSCYFLSDENLTVQIAACDILTAGFKFLAFVSCRYTDPTDEQSKIQNSILRQVATSWPSVKARLVTLAEELSKPQHGLTSLLTIAGPANSTQKDGGSKNASKRVFLAKLYTLIATLCECSGEFMADRFKTDVWKLAVQHLRSNLQVQGRDIPESERLLVAAILGCIRRAFQQKDCRVALTAIMESAGTILLPYLEHDDESIRLSVSETLKSIVSVDYDVLRRPLLALSGRGIPPIPTLKTLRRGSSLSTPRYLLDKQNSVQLFIRSWTPEACNHLLAFMETLPEQNVV